MGDDTTTAEKKRPGRKALDPTAKPFTPKANKTETRVTVPPFNQGANNNTFKDVKVTGPPNIGFDGKLRENGNSPQFAQRVRLDGRPKRTVRKPERYA